MIKIYTAITGEAKKEVIELSKENKKKCEDFYKYLNSEK